MVKEYNFPEEEIIQKDFIEVFGAREHSLKDIDIKKPVF